jgi:ABC-type Fe3+ transport system substrate-binding protein
MKALGLVLAMLTVLAAARGTADAAETVFPPVSGSNQQSMRILSTTDVEILSPVIKRYQQERPNLEIRYEEITSTPLYERAAKECSDNRAPADLVISSAVDLQLKLVNDGCAQSYVSDATQRLPAWAQWRDELFGLTFEPVVVVYNRKALAGTAVPGNRFDIIDLLRASPELFAGKVATYDIEASGVGYLFAFEDARQASTYGRLIESLGRSNVVLQCCTGEILDGVAEGRWLLGYNVIGSYAALHARNDPRIGVIYPEDYTLILSRAAYIPKAVSDPAIAADFLDFTLSETGRTVLAEQSQLHSSIDGIERLSASGLPEQLNTQSLRPIAFTPALLVGLDQHKRRIFLKQWRDAMQATATQAQAD